MTISILDCKLASSIGEKTFLSISMISEDGSLTTDTGLPGNASASAKCTFIDYEEGTVFSSENGESEGCLRQASTSRPEPKFICRKNHACEDLPCTPHTRYADRCVFDFGTQTKADAMAKCTTAAGVLPLMHAQNEAIISNDLDFYEGMYCN